MALFTPTTKTSGADRLASIKAVFSKSLTDAQALCEDLNSGIATKRQSIEAINKEILESETVLADTNKFIDNISLIIK